MLEIEVELRNFGPLPNGHRLEPVSHVELIKSAITVGHCQWPNVWWRYGRPSIFDALRRVFTIKSALRGANRRLHGTRLYLETDPTDKTVISYCIGNTICALLAERIARVPWLMSLRVYERTLRPAYVPGTRRRPDFVGQTATGDWFVFEAKGSSTAQLALTLRKAKAQSATIAAINRVPVVCGLASVAYVVGPDNEVRAIWDDPLLEPGDDANLDLPEEGYFRAYYNPIIALLDAVPAETDSHYGRLAYLPTIDVFVGLHERVRISLQSERFHEVRDFAKHHLPRSPESGEGSGGEVLFPDGVIVRAGGTWSDIFEADNPRARS